MISSWVYLLQHISWQPILFYISFSADAVFFAIVIFDRVYTRLLCIPVRYTGGGCSWSERKRMYWCYVNILMIIDRFRMMERPPEFIDIDLYMYVVYLSNSYL